MTLYNRGWQDFRSRDGIIVSTGRRRSKTIPGMASSFPRPDESFDRLHRAGWSIGETATAGGWLVTGTNGENAIEARHFVVSHS
jgi:hypothetical protein